MSDDGITMSGQDALDAFMRGLSPANFVKNVVVPAAVKIGEQIRDRLEKDPGPSNSPVIWASAKSRAWYHIARKADGLPAKYKRGGPWSQELEQSWVTIATPDGAILGNPADYAPLVQSAEQQSAQHKATGWVTDAQAVAQIEQTDVIGRIIGAEIAGWLAKLGGT